MMNISPLPSALSSALYSYRLRSWAEAVCVGRVHVVEMPGLQGSVLMPLCTRPSHGRGCGCARGTVRYYRTNHHKTSTSRTFNAIRGALGAAPWQEGGDVEVVH